MEKYLIGVLYYGAIDREHDACMQQARRHPLIRDIFSMSGCPYIDIGRSAIASYALDQKTSLLFIDHDILFEPEGITQIIESCEKTRGVVGAGYSMRRAGVQMIGGIDTRQLPAGESVKFFDGGDIYPAVYLGMGFTAIHHDALSRIAQGMPRLKSGITELDMHPYFSLLQRDGNYYGEDVSFCIRAHDAGVPVYMDTRVRVYHKGTYCYGLEDCGYVVPYMNTLVAIMTEGGPAAKACEFTPHPEIAAGHAAREPLDDELFPRSTDPALAARSTEEVAA